MKKLDELTTEEKEIMKKETTYPITFNEYTYVMHRYPCETNISSDDYKKLQELNEDEDEKIKKFLSYIVHKYEIEYNDSSEPLYDDTGETVGYELIS